MIAEKQKESGKLSWHMSGAGGTMWQPQGLGGKVTGVNFRNFKPSL